MKKVILILISIVSGCILTAQDSVSLDTCYQRAVDNYPLTRQKNLINQSGDLKVKNLNKNYLPTMALNGQASYQSDVTKIPVHNLPFSGIEPLSKDWYKINLDVNQVIFDGGATKQQKALEEINTEMDEQNIEVELYNLKNRIKDLYFNIMLINQNRNVLELHLKTLQSKLDDVSSGVKNGTILASNADVLKAEILTIGQAIDATDISLQSAIDVMNEYTGLNLTENTVFINPEIANLPGTYENNRPEYALMSISQKKIGISKKLTGTQLFPRFSAFGQAGYGRPGFDMLENKFTDYYMVGARLNWNFWDWNHSRKEKKILDLKYDMIDTQKETFDKNLKVEITNKQAEISKIENKIDRDGEIIALREKITKSASSQLDNGVITSSEYLTELNAESKAKLDLEIHKIELNKAKLDYQAALGNH